VLLRFPQLVTTGTAAKRLEMSREGISHLISRGMLQSIRLETGQRLLFSDEVDELAEERARRKLLRRGQGAEVEVRRP